MEEITKEMFKGLRLNHGILLTDVAKYFGVTRQTIYNIENGKVPFKPYYYYALKYIIKENEA